MIVLVATAQCLGPDRASHRMVIQPDSWQPNAIATNGEVPVTTRVLCAVKIRSVVPDVEGFELSLDPLGAPLDRISSEKSRELIDRFDTWIRLSGDPGWRFKSAQIQRTRDQRSIFLGIMDYLSLGAKHAESLLLETNEELANRLIDHMTHKYAETDYQSSPLCTDITSAFKPSGNRDEFSTAECVRSAFERPCRPGYQTPAQLSRQAP